jgi:hypothetical protein
MTTRREGRGVIAQLFSKFGFEKKDARSLANPDPWLHI